MILAVLNIGAEVALTVVGAGAVASFTAILTARTTSARQIRQLNAEGERFQDQLSSEERRHDAELVHARDLKDLDDVRGILDEAAEVLARTVKGIALVEIALRRVQGPDQDADSEEFVNEAWDAMVFSFMEMPGVGNRLTLRLGRRHDVSKGLERLIHLLGNAIEASSENPTLAVRRDAMDGVRGSFTDHYLEFLETAREHFGTSVRDSRSALAGQEAAT